MSVFVRHYSMFCVMHEHVMFVRFVPSVWTLGSVFVFECMIDIRMEMDTIVCI